MKLLALNKSVLFYNEFCNNIDTGLIFSKELGRILKTIRMLHLKHIHSNFDVWFSDELKMAGNDVDTVLLFDSILTVPAANFLRKQYPNLRIIYWFWNHIYNPTIVSSLSQGIELWSYDKTDCNKYGMKYNSQFYFNELVTPTSEIKNDLFFIGSEKGRSNAIKEVSDIVDKKGLSKRFIVIGNSRKERTNNWVPYSDVIKSISESKCLVDLVPEVQKGLTIRPLEALFNKKKLITNFKDIINYNFYNPNNIFIIGQDDVNNLSDFINSPFDDIPIEVSNYYDFNNWKNRF